MKNKGSPVKSRRKAHSDQIQSGLRQGSRQLPSGCPLASWLRPGEPFYLFGDDSSRVNQDASGGGGGVRGERAAGSHSSLGRGSTGPRRGGDEWGGIASGFEPG